MKLNKKKLRNLIKEMIDGNNYDAKFDLNYLIEKINKLNLLVKYVNNKIDDIETIGADSLENYGFDVLETIERTINSDTINIKYKVNSDNVNFKQFVIDINDYDLFNEKDKNEIINNEILPSIEISTKDKYIKFYCGYTNTNNEITLSFYIPFDYNQILSFITDNIDI